LKNNKSALENNLRKITQVSETNNKRALQNHKMKMKSELLTDLLALHKIRKKVDATHT
jgi:hypothetical protein